MHADTNQPTTKQCPFCAEEVKYEAIKCRFCQSELPAVEAVEPAESGEEQTDDELMKMYDIGFDGEKYSFLDFRYTKLQDAVNFAKRTKTLSS
jgi:hypothetical protein